MIARSMKRNVARVLVVGAMTVSAGASNARAAMIDAPFDDDHWNLAGAQVVEHLGRTALLGSAMLKDVQFGDGVVEVDIALERERGYPGFAFHVAGPGASESIYIRPHRAGLYADAVQYTPVFNGVSSWQLYSGSRLHKPRADSHAGEWVTLRLEIEGRPGPGVHRRQRCAAGTAHQRPASHGAIAGATRPHRRRRARLILLQLPL
jgi:hypothetical protein